MIYSLYQQATHKNDHTKKPPRIIYNTYTYLIIKQGTLVAHFISSIILRVIMRNLTLVNQDVISHC